MQCLRRWRDEGDKMQFYNAGKYASAMLAMVIKLTYNYKANTTWLILFITFSCIATLYQLYWDLVVDWGLLQRSSRNPWLRDNLVLKKKYIYFVSMVRIFKLGARTDLCDPSHCFCIRTLLIFLS